MNKLCEKCSRVFVVTKHKERLHRFCSRECAGVTKRILHRKCELCGEQFFVGRRVSQKFCSRECAYVGLTKKPLYRLCEYCGIEFKIGYNKLKRFCRRACSVRITRVHNYRWRTCKFCGNKFNAAHDGVHHCSITCSQKSKYPTSVERELYSFLDYYGYVYEQQKDFGRTIPDAFVTSLSLAIFVDGEYWHSLPGRRSKDIECNEYLMSQGIHVIRLDTCRNIVDFIPLVEYLLIG